MYKKENKINLYNFEKKVYSQNGEDGIIEKIFQTIGVKNQYYVEFNVGDGIKRNTRYLTEEYKWNGLLMDREFYNSKINLMKEFITKENINKLFKQYNVPKKFDLLSINIGYNDWYILREILSQGYSPRVIIQKYNSDLLLDDKVVIYDSKYISDNTQYFGASFTAFSTLLNKFGYNVIYCDKNGVNMFAIRRDIDSSMFFSERQIFVKNTNTVIDYLKRDYINSNNIYINIEENLNNISSLIEKKIKSNQIILSDLYSIKNLRDYSIINSIKKDIYKYIGVKDVTEKKIRDIIYDTLVKNTVQRFIPDKKIKNIFNKINKYNVGDEYTKYPYSDKYTFYIPKNNKVVKEKLYKGYLSDKIYNTMILNSFLKKQMSY